MSQEQSRNEPCNCGSGKKYKKCCGNKPSEQVSSSVTPGATFAKNNVAKTKAASNSLNKKDIKPFSNPNRQQVKTISLISNTKARGR